MRIALYHNLPSGGAKRTLAEGARRLAARHHVDVYTLRSAEHEFGDLRPFVASHKIFPFEPLPLLKSPFGRLNQALRYADLERLERLGARIAREIEQTGYDLVFVHHCRFEKSPSVLNYLTNTPSVYYCQEPLRLMYEAMPARPYDDGAAGRRRFLNRLDPLPALYRNRLRRIDQRNTRRAGTVLVNSGFMAGAVGRIYGMDPQVSYHGVDVGQFRPLSVEKRHMVLSVGSLTPLKGFDFLIRAMVEYPSAGRPVLVVASNFQNPPERMYLEELAGELGVELVFAGNLSDQDLVRFYNEAKVVAYTPVREPFGLVPLEAMACKTPVVAVAEGGIPETVIDGQTGFLTARDSGQFAAAVRLLIDDPGMARQFGENGRRHVLENWTWDRAVRSLERRLAATLRERSGVTREDRLSAVGQS